MLNPNAIMAIQKKPTDQKPLTMALKFINEKLHIKDLYLENKYMLSHKTLWKIKNGYDIPRSHKAYMRVFLGILNEKRKECEIASEYKERPIYAEKNRVLADSIKDLLLNILLSEYALL